MWWTVIGMAFVAWLVLVLLFTPRIDYHVTLPLKPDSDEFLRVMQATCQAGVYPGNRVDIFTNGTAFYPAMREAIRSAEASVNLEAYIFNPGDVADMISEVMIERARAGVEVRLVLDAIGSSSMRGEPLKRLAEAGCRVSFYQRMKWYSLH